MVCCNTATRHDPTILEPLVSLMHRITDKNVFADLRVPVRRLRTAQGLGRTLPLADFITLRVLRHLQGMGSLRGQVQRLLQLDPAPGARARRVRSTWSNVLCSPARLVVFKATLPGPVAEAAAVLPDRPGWTVPLFRYIAKVSRQVLRFFKHCFLKPAMPALYARQVRPLLMA